MIKIIKGTYGLMRNGVVEAMTPGSTPFALSPAREAELVAAGVAEKVDEPEKVDSYAGMKMTELRNIAQSRGFDVSGAKTKREIVAALEATEQPPAPESDAEEV